jgi:hypothetical protein
LIWLTMYPVPRMLITAALFLTIIYAIVAFLVLLPGPEAYLAWYAGRHRGSQRARRASILRARIQLSARNRGCTRSSPKSRHVLGPR